MNPVRNTKAITGEGKISNGVNPVRPQIDTCVLHSDKTGRFYTGVTQTDMGNNILEIVLREV